MIPLEIRSRGKIDLGRPGAMLWHSTPASRGLSPKPPAARRRPTAHPARGRKRRVPRQPGPAGRQTEPSTAAESLPSSPINKAPCACWPPHHPRQHLAIPKSNQPPPPLLACEVSAAFSPVCFVGEEKCQLPLLQECPLLNPGLVPGPLLRRSGALPSSVTPSNHQTCLA
ncbi:hypothetical protein VPH35_009501 [Triticum aestivum]